MKQKKYEDNIAYVFNKLNKKGKIIFVDLVRFSIRLFRILQNNGIIEEKFNNELKKVIHNELHPEN